MPSYLVSAVDAQGRLRLVSREDGKGLLTNDGCEDCCNPGGECATIRRYNRCAPTDQTAGCQSNPDHLWLCESPDMLATIREGNSCYSKTDTTIPTAQIPVGDVLLIRPSSARPTGCSDPTCTECLHFYLAEPCPGQDMTGKPPVYMLVQDVPPIGAGQDCPGFGMNSRCYTIRPGTMYTLAEVNAAGGVINGDRILPGYIPLKCCECVSGCAVTSVPTFEDCGLGTRTINLNCCCSDEWTATVVVSWTESTTSTAPNGDVFVFTRQAAGTVTISSTIAPDAPRYVRVIETATKNGSPDPTVLTQDHDMQVPFSGACPPGPIQFRGEFGTGFCPLGGPSRIESGFPGTYQEVVRADSFLTCNTFSSNYHYRTFEAGQQRIDNVATYSITVRHTGRCGGGCGQASGVAPNAAGAVLAKQQAKVAAIKAVPRSQWPIWAKAIALRSAPEDKGVGDTFARTTGPIGGDAFKSGMKAIGKECSCEFRQAEWNAAYPY